MTDAPTQDDILQGLLHKIAKEQHYNEYDLKIIPVSADGSNYTTSLYRVIISELNKPDLNLFAKVAAVGEKFRSQMLTQIFEVEFYFYETVVKMFDRIQDLYEVPKEYRLVLPKFYGCDDTYLQETLVLEDLAEQGFVMHNRQETINWEYAAQALEQLGKIHALSVAFQEDYPKEFEEATKVLKTQNIMEQSRSDEMLNLTNQVINRTVALVGEEYKERLQKLFNNMYDNKFFMFGPQKRPVLQHGDFKMSNLMHRKREDKLEVITLDFQWMHVGVGIRDVLYFVLTGSDEEFREKHFHQLLEHYYDQVCLMLRRLKKDPEMLFPRGDFDWELEKNLPHGIIVAIYVLPLLTVAEDDAPKVDSDLAVENMLVTKTNELSDSRIVGIVKDAVRWGII